MDSVDLAIHGYGRAFFVCAPYGAVTERSEGPHQTPRYAALTCEFSAISWAGPESTMRPVSRT